MNEELKVNKVDSVKKNKVPKKALFERMHEGNGYLAIIPNKRKFFVITGLIFIICIVSMVVRGFTFGIEFSGGTQVTFPAKDNISTTEVGEVFAKSAGEEAVSVQTIGSGNGKSIQIRSESLTQPQVKEVQKALYETFKPTDKSGKASAQNISFSEVSSSWGKEITEKAFRALIIFLLAVMVYIGIRFERDMAIAALVALIFDLVTTAGVYSIVGFEVAPATVIGLLTILGYSLYDTVVVFDKVRENTEGILKSRRRTYAEAATLAVNETLIRSINTSIISIMPIVALMWVSVVEMSVGVLKDLSLVLLIGIIAGTFSSIFIATPLLVELKNSQSAYKEHDSRVKGRRAKLAAKAAQA